MGRSPEVAIALHYDDAKEMAPEVVAKGERLVAKRIVEVAREAGVPVLRNVDVARVLSGLEVGDEIPEEMYEAVAGVLRLVAEIEREEKGTIP